MKAKLTFPASSIILGIIPNDFNPNCLLALLAFLRVSSKYSIIKIIPKVKIPPKNAAAIISIPLLVGLGDKG